MRNSRFYYPLKQALNFNPTVLMVLVALALLWYVVSGVVGYLVAILQRISQCFLAFGTGHIFYGAVYVVGCILLAVLFFLMTLMTLIFINWIFGLFNRASTLAYRRISPLLNLFEFGGIFRGWSFMVLSIALSIAATAVQIVFFPSLPSAIRLF
jgi:hypothetical protein